MCVPRVSQVVEVKTVEALRCRYTLPRSEQSRQSDRLTVVSREDKLLAVRPIVSTGAAAQVFDDDRWKMYATKAGLGLGWSNDESAAGELLNLLHCRDDSHSEVEILPLERAQLAEAHSSESG